MMVKPGSAVSRRLTTEALPDQKSRMSHRHHNIVGGAKSSKALSRRCHGRGHVSAGDWLSMEIFVNYERL
jgi:hypothetical protein